MSRHDDRSGETEVIDQSRVDEIGAHEVLPVPEDRRKTVRGILQFNRRTRRYLRSAKAKGLFIYRLSLTHPRPWTVASFLYAIAIEYAKCVNGDGEGIWLMADWSPTGAVHWYGLAITRQSADALRRRWVKMTGAAPSAVDVALLNDQNDRSSLDFYKSLARVILYGCKDVPRVLATRAERAIASGVFVDLWRDATGREPMDADFDPPLPVSRVPPRVCERPGCGRLTTGLRSHAKFCSPACRKKFHEDADADQGPSRPTRPR